MVIYDYLIHFPADAPTNWLLTSKPIGINCLLYTKDGQTYMRDRMSLIVSTFQSSLPNGSIATKSKLDVMLHCIYTKETNTTYPIDILRWEDHEMIDSPFEARWRLMINYLENTPGIANITSTNEIRIRYCPNIYKCTCKNFNLLYFSNSLENLKPTESPLFGLDQLNEQFVRDGILLINAESPYIMGISPFYLQWKDHECSLSYKESNEKMVHVAKLYLNSSGELITEDKIAMYTMSKEEIESQHHKTDCRYVVLYESINIEKNELVGVKIVKKLYNGILSSYSQIMFYNKDFKNEVCFKKMMAGLQEIQEQGQWKKDEEPMEIIIEN